MPSPPSKRLTCILFRVVRLPYSSKKTGDAVLPQAPPWRSAFDNKCNVRLEVLKSTGSTFEDASGIALRVDRAFRTFKGTSSNSSVPGSSGYSPMEIEDSKNRKPTNGSQRQKDLNNVASFACH